MQGLVKPWEPSDSNTPSSLEDAIQPNDGTPRDSKVPVTRSSHDVQTSSIPPQTSIQADEKRTEVADGDAIDAKHETLERTVSTVTASSDGAPGEDDESKYPKGPKLYLLTFGLSMSTFVIALDNTIIATAIPRITTVFNSLNDVGWYGSAYLLTTTSLQPSFGKVYTYFNIKWTYIIAIIIFEAGSVLCAAAQNSRMLIIGRAVAGVGAAAIFSGGMTIVGYSVPLRKRPIYIGLLSSMFGISSVIGPILGGALTDREYPSPSCLPSFSLTTNRCILALVLLDQPPHRRNRDRRRLLLLPQPRPQTQ
jgi:Major Facilitator Superfamily